MGIERQEKSLVQLETKRSVVKDLIEKGRKILENPDKPKFLEAHVERIEVGWDDTKEKAQDRLTLLNNTKDAWVGYAENNDTIIIEIEKGLEEIKKVKKRFNLQSAFEDLAKRQEIFNKTKDSIMGLYNEIKHNVEVMSLTIPEDKKKLIEKEIKALSEKLVVVSQFEEKVNKIDDFCKNLNEFDGSLKSIDAWMTGATNELNDIKNSSDKMAPEDRVARTMDLQEDIAAKFEIIKANTSRRRPRTNVTSTLRMSSSGLSIEPASRSSPPGWSRPRLPPPKALASPPTWMRPLLWPRRSTASRRLVLITCRSWRLLTLPPRR